jgi:hypothetical protein
MADAPELSQYQQFYSDARQQGYTADQIHDYTAKRYQFAISQGADPEKLNAALGYTPDPGIAQRQAAQASATYRANPPVMPATASPWQGFQAGVDASSGGLLVQTAEGKSGADIANWQANPLAPMATHLAYLAGSAVGDFPAMVAGALGGGFAAAETGPGAVLAAGAGAFALPAHIRQEYADSLRNGHVSSPQDFAARQALVWAETGKAGFTGAAAAYGGLEAGAALKAASITGVPARILQGAAELAAMTVTSDALAHKLPSMEEVIDNAIVMAAAGGAIHLVKGSPTLAAAVDNTSRVWVKTGEEPEAQARRALSDPSFRQYQSTPSEAPRWTPPGSASVSYLHSPGTPDSYTIPRAPGNFEAAAAWMLKQEGSLTSDTGGVTKYGISSNAHPGLDVKNISPAQAVQLYHDEYWAPLHIDSLPDSMKLRVFDAAINEGAAKAKAMLEQSGNDPVAFDELRKEHYRGLADGNPGKFGKYLPTWLGRVDHVNGGASLADGLQLAKDLNGGDKPISDDLAAIAMRQADEEAGDPHMLSRFTVEAAGGGGEPPGKPPTTIGEDGIEREEPDFRAVLDRSMADATKPPTMMETIKTKGYKLYLEMMNPDDPIGRLTQAVLEGGKDLPDAANPYLLQRLAETTSNRAMYGLEQGQVDNDGNLTGRPGMKQILDPVEKTAAARADFWRYAMSKWAVEKSAQGKETGVDLPAAMKMIAEMEEGGLETPNRRLEDFAKDSKTKINWLPASHPNMAWGPHFRIDTNEVNMLDATEDEYIKKFGRGLTRDVVLAHELGHAQAFHVAEKFGRGTWDNITEAQRTDLEDELTINSRRFKPGLWADWGQREHVTKNSELIADAMATWMSDPVARTRMPEFQKLMEAETGGKWDPAKELGAIPEKWGTPAQMAFEQLQDFQNADLKYAYKGGVISREQYVLSVASHEAYVPGQRNMVEIEHVPPGGKHSGQNPFNPLNRFVGSDRQLKNIKESIIKDHFLRISLADHNRVNVAAADAALSIGEAREERAARVSIPMGQIEAAMALGEKDDVEHRGLDFTLSQLAGKALKTDEVPVMRNGELTKVVFKDPELAGVLKGMSKPALDTWTGILAFPAKVQRGLIVSNPLFPVHILGYDLPFQFITKPDFRNTVGQAIAGFSHVFGKTATYDSWVRTGAPDRIMEGLSKSDYIAKMLDGKGDPHLMDGVFNVVNSPVRALRAWGTAMSQVMPVGRFAQLEQTGISPERRAFEASESPFHRSGFGGPTAKKINAQVPFTTAYLNGLEKAARALTGLAKPGDQLLDEEGKPIVWNPKQMAQTWAKAAAIITTPILLQEAQNHDKHWYKAVPDFVKDNSLVFHLGDDWETTNTLDKMGNPVVIAHGTTLVYKFPPIFSFIFGAIPRRLMAGLIEHDPEAMHNLGGSALEGFAPPGGMYPSVFLPFVEHAANYSFFGHHQLVSDNASHSLETQYQYTPYSTATARALSSFINDTLMLHGAGNYSPPVIDNYIKSWSGTMGEGALHLIEGGLREAGALPSRNAELHLEDTPFLSSFMVRYPNYSAEPIRQFEDHFDRFATVHGSLNKMFEEDNFAEFQHLIQENPGVAGLGRLGGRMAATPANPDQYGQAYEAAAKAISPATIEFLQAAKAIKNEQAMVKYITQLPTTQSGVQGQVISPRDKQQLLDQHFATMSVMAERANDLADKAGLR